MIDCNIGRNYSDGKQGNQGRNKRYESATLPEGYLQGGYYNDSEKKKLKKEYIVCYPKELAKALEGDGGRDMNKSSQIRKFYRYLLRADQKMRLHDNDFTLIESDIARLQPHVSYAGKRKVVSPLFIRFIEENVAAVHDEKDMEAFVRHFEAIIAFTRKD